MPPKASLRNKSRRSAKISRKSVPSTLPLYQMISQDSHQSESDIFAQMIKKMTQIYNQSEQKFIQIVMNFVLEICGMSKYSQKVNWRQDIEQQMGQILETAQQKYKKDKNKGKPKTQNIGPQKPEFPLLFLKKTKYMTNLYKNITNFFNYLFSEDIPAIFETNIIKILLRTLKQISQCKLRNIRASSVQICKIIIDAALKYCSILEKQEDASAKKHRKKLLNILQQGFVQQIIKNRLKDIDLTIRERAIKSLEQVIYKLSNQDIDDETIQKIIIPLFNESNTKILELTLNILQKFIDSKKGSNQAKINLCLKVIPNIYELCLKKTNISSIALKCLSKLQKYSQSPKILSPKQIVKLFQYFINDTHKTMQNVKYCLQLFIFSITSYHKKSDLLQLKQTIIIQFINLTSSLLTTININQNMKNSIVIYGNSHNNQIVRDMTVTLLSILNTKQYWIIKFQDILLLLFSEYYYSEKQQVDVQFRDIDLFVLLNMCFQYNKYVSKTSEKLKKDSQVGQKLIQEMIAFNQKIAHYTKDIIYEKVVKYPHFSHLYINMFAILYHPLDKIPSNNLDFILQKIIDILGEQKYIVMAIQDICMMYNIIRSCIQAYSNITQKNPMKIYPLIDNLKVHDICRQSKLDPIDIIKISALSSEYKIQEFLHSEFFKTCFSCYSESRESMMSYHNKLQFLTFFSNIHQQLFSTFIEEPSQTYLSSFTTFRNSLLDLITVLILNNQDEHILVKVGSFGLLCQILKISGNQKFSDAIFAPIQCQLNDRQLQSISEFIQQIFTHEFQNAKQVANDQKLLLEQFSSNIESSVSKMLSNITIQSLDIKHKVLDQLFSTYIQNNTFLFNSIPLICKLLLVENLVTYSNKKNNSLIGEQSLIQNYSNAQMMLWLCENLSKLFNSLIKKEIRQQNNNKFIYWRVYRDIQIYLQKIMPPRLNRQSQNDDQQSENAQNVENQIQQNITLNTLNRYLKFKKNHTKSTKTLNDKMMLYLADSLDKIIATYIQIKQQKQKDRHQKIQINLIKRVNIIYKMIQKVHRRYPKQILHRFSMFFHNKLNHKSEQFQVESSQQRQQIQKVMKNLKNYLEKISKINNKKQNTKQQPQNNEQSSDAEPQKQSEQSSSEDENQNKRITRSKTKKRAK